MSACIDCEVMLASADPEDRRLPAVLAHLATCEACARLARELQNPVVAAAMADASDAAFDLAELPTVPSELYRRGQEIGRGGMGRILRARDRRLGRAVAIKELLDERMRTRFEHEARLTARLQHPAIVSIHEVGRWPNGASFYAMKYVAGRPLHEVIADRRSLPERLALLPSLVTVVEAIAYAHSERIIHRDLKPHNILLGAFGETVVIDWGLAKELGVADDKEAVTPYRDGAMDMTHAGAGTPDYMPPEQARGEQPDERFDVFALGATLHHLLAGGPARLEPLPDEVPPELAAIVAKATAPASEDRYRSARELADELTRFQSGKLVGAHHYSLRQLGGRFLRRHRSSVALVAASLVALAFVGGVSLARVLEARRDAEAQRDDARRAQGLLLVERGRLELELGAPARALAYLGAGLALGGDSRAARFLVAEARRGLAPLLLSTDDEGRGVAAAALDPDGARLCLRSRDGDVRIVDVASGKTRFELSTKASDMVVDPWSARLVTWSEGADEARLWDVATGRLLADLPTGDHVGGARFHPSGRLVTWSGAGASVWSESGALVTRTTGHTELVFGAALDRSAKHLATASRDGTVRLWDASSGSELRSFRHPAGVGDVGFDPDGKRIVTAGWDHRARIFEVATGALLRELELEESLRTASFSADGRAVFASGSYSAAVWDAERGTELTKVRHGGYALATARLSPEGTRILRAGYEGTAWLQELDGRVAASVEGHALPLLAIAASGDGGRLVTVDDRGTAKVWNAGAVQGPTSLPGRAYRAAFDTSGRLAINGSRWFELRDARDGKLLASRLSLDLANPKILPAEDGTLHVFDREFRHRLWDVDTGALTGEDRLPQGFVAAAYAPAAGVVAAISVENMRKATPTAIVLYELATGRRLATFGETIVHQPVVLSPDAAWLATIGKGKVTVWDTRSGRIVGTIASGRSSLSVALHPSSGIAVVVDANQNGAIWDVASGRIVRTLTGGLAGLRSVDITADGELVLGGGLDGSAALWSAASGQRLRTWKFPSPVTRVDLSPDGSRALVRSGVASWLVDVTGDERAPPVIIAEVAAAVPVRYEDGNLVPTVPASNFVANGAPPSRAAPGIDCPPGTRPRGARPPGGTMAWCESPDGRVEGPTLRWQRDGVKLAEREGDRETIFDPSGRATLRIEDQGLDQTDTALHADGSVASILHRQYGEPAGDYRGFYPDGSVREVGRYKDAANFLGYAIPDGLWTTFHPGGRKASEGLYLARLHGGLSEKLGPSVPVGKWSYWDAAGRETVIDYGCPERFSNYIDFMPVQPVCK